MPLEDLVILLPCYSLEDLPLDWTSDDAQSLLSAWTALYHPALLAAADRLPRWFRADDPPADPAGNLVAIPQCCETRLPDSWPQRANQAGACVLQHISRREDVVRDALAYVTPDLSRLDPDLADDFLALGFCHLQVELLTRQLRYMSNLDTDRFQREAVGAARKAVEGDTQAARDQLRSAFELLTDAREYYYPVEANLLDLTLVAPSTAGSALRGELASQTPVNLMLSGETLGAIAQREPATLDAIRDGLTQGKLAILGGEYQEREIPLMPLDRILRQFHRGLALYQHHLGTRPAVFARRRFGLTPALPGILRGLGFNAAVHFTLDDGQFPVGNQSKIRWEGRDGQVVEALARLPIDAARSEQFFKLPEKLGNTMDMDHAATVVFAHWPGHASPWYHDLKRMAAYSPVLGRFIGMDSYFQNMQMVGSVKRYSADEYRSPYLRQQVAAGQSDPISRWVRYDRTRLAMESSQTLATLTALISRRPNDCPDSQRPLDELEDLVAAQSPEASELPQPVEERLQQTARDATRVLAGQQPADEGQAGYLLWNPWSFPRRVYLDVSAFRRPAAVDGPIWRCAETGGQIEAVVDVPAMGFAWVGPQTDSPPAQKATLFRRKSKHTEPPLAEPYVLRNEFFEATIEPTTGAIRSICLHNTRGNRLSQQLAMRIPAPSQPRNVWGEEDTEQDYSVMAADKLSVDAGPLVGRIQSRGRLLDRTAQLLARFTQTLTVRRGSRILELEIELDIDRQPDADPWNSYYALRFAWGNAVTNLCRGVHGASHSSEALLCETPQFIDLRSGKGSTTILTGGLPYHRRFGPRKLDSLLIVRGENARRFRLGIGVDLDYPAAAALDFMAPVVAAPAARAPRTPAGWLFHIDARNVVASDWQPLLSDRSVVGYRVNLLETEGRTAQVGVRSLRAVASANRADFDGGHPTVLPVQDDRVTIGIDPYQCVCLEARFAS